MNKIENIAGYEKEKEVILRLRKMLLNHNKYVENGIKIPKGMVIAGEPGIGKTALARSLVVPGISEVYLTSSDCVGDGAERAIHQAFLKAQKLAPSVLILDELDKMAGESSPYYDDNKDYMKTLIHEMDMLDSSIPMMVVATCNHKEFLDDSLIRSGRFDKVIMMEKPDAKTRELIADLYLGKLHIPIEVTGKFVSRITTEYSCADIETAINEGAILAMDRDPSVLTENDVRVAMNRIVFGSIEDSSSNNNYDHITAVHESGHTLVAALLTPERLVGVSIVPQGNARGFVRIVWDERNRESFDDVENRIRVRLAGRVAEKLVFGKNFVGSSADLIAANNELKNIATLEGAYGYKYLSGEYAGICIPSDNSKMELELLIARKLEEFEKDVAILLSENRDIFDAITASLMSKKVLSEDEIREICNSANIVSQVTDKKDNYDVA